MKRVREGTHEGRNVRRKERKEGSDGRNEALERLRGVFRSPSGVSISEEEQKEEELSLL